MALALAAQEVSMARLASIFSFILYMHKIIQYTILNNFHIFLFFIVFILKNYKLTIEINMYI